MSSHESPSVGIHNINADPPESIYDDPQGQYFTDADEVPGRIRRMMGTAIRTQEELVAQVHQNPKVTHLVDQLHLHDFYVTAEAIAGDISLTVQKNKKPVLGITAAALAAGAIVYEVVKRKKATPDSGK